MSESYVCPRCGNKDPRTIGHRNGKPYCRLCLSFQGKEADASYLPKENLSLSLTYPLSPKQEEVSKKVLSLLKQRKNALIHAVTGAGKTELVYASMEHYLRKRLHVGFATPRKDVVIDLAPRIEEAFPKAKVVSVYGEHTSLLVGDILVLTTHQLYRYPKYFDLLILDEIDAFPYRDNQVLNAFFYRAVKGNYVLLSATPSQKDIESIEKENGEVVTLFERYHHSPLPEPKILKITPLTGYFTCMRELRGFLEEGKPVFVFVPTIDEGKSLFHFLSLFLPGGGLVSSKQEERRIEIERFKSGTYRYLVTTSILERGVTVKNLQVIVYHADHSLYTKAALIQIAGRVGRKIGATRGEVLFLSESNTSEEEEAIYEIHRTNIKAKLL